MKIVLTMNEVIQIVGDHLASIGKLEFKVTEACLCIDNKNAAKSYIEFEQTKSDFNEVK